METTTIHRWDELNDVLYANAWKEQIGRFRSDFVYRGMPSAEYTLESSLVRMGSNYEQLEQHLLRAFRRYAYRYASFEDSVWSWLALAQHHGLPTRLLDFTYSPYVAMHFATANPTLMEQDAVIWCIDVVKCQQFLPSELQVMLKEEGTMVFTTEMLREKAASLSALKQLGELPFVLFFEPHSFDDRIVNQFALFGLMSNVTTRLDMWLAEQHGLSRRIIIPAALKWEVRDKLDQANVTERVLLPGLDGLSAWLARYYRPHSSGVRRGIEGQ